MNTHVVRFEQFSGRKWRRARLCCGDIETAVVLKNGMANKRKLFRKIAIKQLRIKTAAP
jgi:hypothetical protein